MNIDDARRMHSGDLMRSQDAVAQQQLHLRESGGATVRGVLAALGYRYHAHGGWHILAFVSARSEIGFVNIARGVAVLTDAVLGAEVVEALTVPEEGPLVSGAAAWTVDVGEAHRASAPPGWRQLALDLRDHLPVAEVPKPSATVVAWGLATCYESRRGPPGQLSLDSDDTRMPPREWPYPHDRTRTRMDELGERWLGVIASCLAVVAGCGPEVTAALDRSPPDLAAADKAAYVWSDDMPYTAGHALEMVLGERVLRDALRRHRIARIADMCGDIDRRMYGERYYDLCAGLLKRILRQRLAETSRVLYAMLVPFFPGSKKPTGGHKDGGLGAWVSSALQPMLLPLVIQTADVVLSGIAEGARKTEDEMVAVYYEHGHVEVSIPMRPRTPRLDEKKT